ncbi:MAG: hypothetical protein WCX82_02115 [archaeon]|jgi:hypothetical protein
MPIRPKKMPIKNLQKISIAKLPEKIRLKIMVKSKKELAEITPRPNRLDSMMRTDKHIGDLAITYDYNHQILKSSTKETLELIKRNMNTTLKHIEKDLELYSGWELSGSESVALKFLKTNFNREKAFAEKKIKEIDDILLNK